MPHITLNSTEPGIRGLLSFRPETGRPLSEAVEVLLRGPGTLTRGERELIAAYVSSLNDCQYMLSHPTPPPRPRSCREAWRSWTRSAPMPAARPSPGS